MRSRNIKPGFFKNENLTELSPYARLLFIGLWLLADKEGRLEERPKKIRAEIFPYETSVEVEKLLDEFGSYPEEFIHRYEVDGRRYIQILNFKEHQNPHKQEKPSEIPPSNTDSKIVSGIYPEITGQVRNNIGSRRAESLNPESLNPESLNPESLNPEITSPSEKAQSASNPIWGDGLNLLVNSGVNEPQARTFLGRAIKIHGEGAVSDAISATLLSDPADPKSYLMACLKQPQRKKTAYCALPGNQITPAGERKGGEIKW